MKILLLYSFRILEKKWLKLINYQMKTGRHIKRKHTMITKQKKKNPMKDTKKCKKNKCIHIYQTKDMNKKYVYSNLFLHS